MLKRAQYTSLGGYQPAVQGKTLEDLYVAIRADSGLTVLQRQDLLMQVQQLAGTFASPNTSLSSLMSKGLGGILGYLISKYFGMGPVGQLVSAVAGFGLGSALHNALNKQPDPFPGFKMLQK